MRSFVALIALLSNGARYATALAPAGPWDAFNYAPKSRTVYPKAIHSVNGSVSNAGNLVGNMGSVTFSGQNSWVALDFGIEVGGLVSLNIGSAQSSSSFALSFTESSMYIRSYASDDSSNCASSTTLDGVLSVAAPLKQGFWTQPTASLRGGFRYLTIVSTSSAPITISNVTCSINFMPHIPDLRAYTGYFYAKDPVAADVDVLHKAYYAGAYTLQTTTIPSNTARHWPLFNSFWANDAVVGNVSPVIVDGAKRDRTIWPGDLGIAGLTTLYALGEVAALRNSLSLVFSEIASNGGLPFAGPPINIYNSDTYHSWTLVATYNFFIFSGDTNWLTSLWPSYTKAVNFVESKINSNGLLDASGWEDWGRNGGGGINSAVNALAYKVLSSAAELATILGHPDQAVTWAAKAAILKAAYNKNFWDDGAGMFRDKAGSTLYAQDGNSLAVTFNLTTSLAQTQRISDGLFKNWNSLGSVSTELPDTIIPFISSFEVQAHFEAERNERAVELVRRTWGFLVNTPLSVQSSLLEGFTASGTLGYRANTGYNNDMAYTSHAHGWSTGPTFSLVRYVLGIHLTSAQGRTFELDPHYDGLTLPAAEGGFETALGWFGVKWTRLGGDVVVVIDAPKGTSGTWRIDKSSRVRVLGAAAKDAAGKPEGTVGSVVQIVGGAKETFVAQSI